MNVTQGIQSPISIAGWKPISKIPFLPKMSRAIEHSVKTHSCVPIKKVHNFGQIFGLFRLNEVMDMITHNTEGIEFKIKFIQRPFNGIEKHLPTSSTRKFKFTIIAASCHMIGRSSF